MQYFVIKDDQPLMDSLNTISKAVEKFDAITASGVKFPDEVCQTIKIIRDELLGFVSVIKSETFMVTEFTKVSTTNDPSKN